MQHAAPFDEYRAFLRKAGPEDCISATELMTLGEEKGEDVDAQEALREIIAAPRFYFDMDVSKPSELDALPDWKTVDRLFLMPSRVVAIEDKSGCAMVSVMCQPDETQNLWGTAFTVTQIHRTDGELYMLQGAIRPYAMEDDIGEKIRFSHGRAALYRRMYQGQGTIYSLADGGEDAEPIRLALWTTFATAARMIALLNSPKHWIVKKQESVLQRKTLRPHSKKTVRRRTRYIVVDHDEMTRIIRPQGGGDNHEVAPHFRRAHWRFLSSERYVQKRGKAVKVRSTWVGADEAIGDDGARYRVIHDPPQEFSTIKATIG